jgi:hypothetical protein
MKGFNRVLLCPAAMNEAMQVYLNSVFTVRNEVKVVSVKMTLTGEFEVGMEELNSKEAK